MTKIRERGKWDPHGKLENGLTRKYSAPWSQGDFWSRIKGKKFGENGEDPEDFDYFDRPNFSQHNFFSFLSSFNLTLLEGAVGLMSKCFGMSEGRFFAFPFTKKLQGSGSSYREIGCGSVFGKCGLFSSWKMILMVENNYIKSPKVNPKFASVVIIFSTLGWK